MLSGEVARCGGKAVVPYSGRRLLGPPAKTSEEGEGDRPRRTSYTGSKSEADILTQQDHLPGHAVEV